MDLDSKTDNVWILITHQTTEICH